MATDAVVGCLEVEVQGLNGAFYRVSLGLPAPTNSAFL